MDASESPFLHDLAVTEGKAGKVLLIGSCLAQAYLGKFKSIAPNVTFDWAMFNTATDSLCLDESRLPSYDLQYILLPLRPILSNQAIDYAGLLSEGTAEVIYLRARQTLLLMLDGALQFNKTAHGLTYVANFLVPPVPAMAAASPHQSIRDLTSIVRRLNNDLAARVGRYRNVAVADVDAVANALGKSDALDDGMTFAAHAMVLRALLRQL